MALRAADCGPGTVVFERQAAAQILPHRHLSGHRRGWSSIPKKWPQPPEVPKLIATLD